MKKKILKRYKDLETGRWFTRDESESIIIKYTPEECKNEKLREKKVEEAEKLFSEAQEEEKESNDNSEETKE